MKAIRRFAPAAALVAAVGLQVPAADAATPSGEIASSLSWRFAYDAAGQVSALVDSAGRRTEIRREVDEAGRLKRATVHSAGRLQVTYELDRFGRRISMADSTGITNYQYDGFDRLVAVRRAGAPPVAYSYDTLDRVVSLSLGDGLTIRYLYDYLGRLSSLETPVGSIAYQYQTGQGFVLRTLPTGTRTVWAYRPDGALDSITHATRESAVLARFAYTRRPDGLITGVQELGPSGERRRSYSYDAVQRLVRVVDSRRPTRTFRYDDLGNRLEAAADGQRPARAEYDWTGRMVAQDGQACLHDAIGNWTSCGADPGGRAFQFEWRNLLASASTAAGPIAYGYDGDGNLVSRTVNGETTRFIPDPLSPIWRPLLAIDPGGATTFYVWEGDQVLAEVTKAEPKFYLHDHLGSVRAVLDRQGRIIREQDYQPFGVPEPAVSGASIQPAFAGMFYEPTAGLYLTRARSYDPGAGRFLQGDPKLRLEMAAARDLSRYAYCGGDPINWLDLTGAEPELRNWSPMYRAWQEAQARLALPDPGTAKKWLAEQETNVLKAPIPMSLMMQQNYLMAAMKVISYDAIGGLIPGRPMSFGQGVATIGWTAVGGVGIVREVPAAVDSLLAVQAVVSASHNVGQRDFAAAALDVVGLGATAGKAYAEALHTAPVFLQPAQGSFSFMSAGRSALATAVDANSTRASIGVLWGQTGSAGHDLGSLIAQARGPTAPSPVGGVSLRGAGEALRDLGSLAGVAVDEATGRLVLLSSGKGEVNLPPLRLEEVVTVFRSVYEHGEAPFVSIDPDPKDPTGPAMVVRHGAATAGTYVGWVLFEADRMMKAYSLGFDNLTRSKLETKVAGYQGLLAPGLSGPQTQPNEAANEATWERFWIVPAQVNRRQATSARLTLLEVPLKVNTQRMELRDGVLVPAPDDRPSKPAARFAEWFTAHYDDLAREATARPPGGGPPVSFFAELRRIALVTAIAESLRDQGVPFPAWMRDYPVTPLPLAPTTPAITVETASTNRQLVTQDGKTGIVQTTQVARIHGGVSLSAPDQDVHTVSAPREAEALGLEIARRVPAGESLAALELESGGHTYRAAVLPGGETRDIGANVLDEVDLVVPVQNGTSISLGRRFHSFFRPSGPFGVGWAGDQPRLETLRQPLERSGEKVKSAAVYQLSSPFGSWSERFSRRAFAEEVQAEVIGPATAGNALGIVRLEDQRIGQPTRVLLFRDGRRWHFDDDGRLVASNEAPLTVIYRRDGAHRVRRIEGWYGAELRADIRLEYDPLGHLAAARGSDASEVQYAYDGAGQLVGAAGPRGSVEYQYRDGLVCAVIRGGTLEARFEYAARGVLAREERAGGGRVDYGTSRGREGTGVVSTRKDERGGTETIEYDLAFRPVRQVGEDGTELRWRHGSTGTVEIEAVSPRGNTLLSRSADERQQTVRLPAGGLLQTDQDLSGRATRIRKGQAILLQQEWRPDGQLATARSDSTQARFGYRADGLLDRLLVTPRDQEASSGGWLAATTDALGRPAKIEDSTGLELQIGYDRTGQASAWATPHANLALERDDRGRPRSLRASWGLTAENAFDPKTSELVRTDYTVEGARASVELARGRPVRLTDLAGAEVRIAYHDPGTHLGQVKTIRQANGLDLAYDYDAQNRLAAVDLGRTCRLEYTYDTQGRLISLRQVRR